MTKRAAIYARYSSKMQKPTSIEDQIAMARRYCANNDIEVVHVFYDVEKTGRHDRRDGLIALKAALEQGAFDIVIIEAVDRLTRNVGNALKVYDLFQFQNIGLYSLAEGHLDFFSVLLLAFGAQQFSEKIADHTRRGMMGGIERGRLHTSAYGYRRRDVEEGLNREIDPDEAAIVLRIFAETAAGKSALTIARGLNTDRIPAPQGGTWEASTIRGNSARYEGILNNRLYIGEASVCKLGRRYHPETGQKAVFATEEDAVTKQFEELRIVPQGLWEAAQAELDKRRSASKTVGNPHKARRAKHLLTGLMTCGVCGQPYVKVGRNRFGCREARKHACSNRLTIGKASVEARIFAQLRDALTSPDLIETFEKAFQAELDASDGVDLERAITRAVTELAKTRKARRSIMRAIENGADFADYSARDKALKTEEGALERRIVDLRAQQEAKDRPPPDIRAIFWDALERLEELLGHPDTVVQANEHLSTLIQRLKLTPDPEADDGLAAEIHMDLGSLRIKAGLAGAPGKCDLPEIERV